MLLIILLLIGIFGFCQVAAKVLESKVITESPEVVALSYPDEVIIVPDLPAPPAPAPPATPPPPPRPTSGIDLKSPHKGNVDVIRAYLETVTSQGRVGSPLAPYAAEIAKSEFWALIIAICHPEQYNCTKAPYWNFWGMMKPGGERAGIRRFSSAEEAIAFMDQYFVNLYTRTYNPKKTIESLRGYYCASACTHWEPTVKRVKASLESL